MAEWVSAEEIQDTLDRLVDAWDARAEAQRFSDEFDRTTSRPPPPPKSFAGVDALVNYLRREQDYKARLEAVENVVKEANDRYDAIAAQVRTFLPKRRSLVYTYEGKREELHGMRYVVQRTTADLVTVEPYMPLE